MTQHPTQTSESWRHDGRCNDASGSLVRLFFSDDYFEIERAKAICAPCPVAVECLAAARAQQENYGVWGGELFMNGSVYRKQPRGRPPKDGWRFEFADVPIPPDLLAA